MTEKKIQENNENPSTLRALMRLSCFVLSFGSSNYCQMFEGGYFATDFHGSKLIVQEDVEPFAWYCLTLNIQKLADETAVVKNIQQGDLCQFLSPNFPFLKVFQIGLDLDGLIGKGSKGQDMF